jgi:hypothetical protein
MNIEDTCKHTKIRLIAAAIAHQQCTQTAGTEVQITGTDKRILIGDDAYLAEAAAPAKQSDLTLRAAIEKALEGRHIEDGTIVAFNDVVDAIERAVDSAAPAAQAHAELTDEHRALIERAASAVESYGNSELAVKLRAIEREVRLSAVREARNEALEEAAKLVLSKAGQQISFADMTGAIRALKAEARAAKDQARNEAQWISVDETLPEEEVPVLTYGAKRTEWAVMQRISGDWNIETASDFHSSYAPKFWMPLPESPTASKEGGA